MRNQRTDDEDEDDKVVKDGGRIVVPVMMMDEQQRDVASNVTLTDTVGHRPGSLPLSVEDRQRRHALYLTKDRMIADAWNTAGDPGAAARLAPAERAIAKQRQPISPEARAVGAVSGTGGEHAAANERIANAHTGTPATAEAAYKNYDTLISERWKGAA